MSRSVACITVLCCVQFGCSPGGRQSYSSSTSSSEAGLKPASHSVQSTGIEESDLKTPPAAEQTVSYAGGVFLRGEDLQWIRRRIQEQVEPFSTSFEQLRARADSALAASADPFRPESLSAIRFGWCEDLGGADDTLKKLTQKLLRQSDTARALALAYVLSGRREYADKALEMLLAWVDEGFVLNLYDLHIDFARATFDGMTADGSCGIRPWNFALDSIWQTYGLINFSDAYALLTWNGYALEAQADLRVREWLYELAEAVNSGFHAWTRWADTHPKSSSYMSYRSGNHLSWSLAGLLAAAVALGDLDLATYCLEGGAWADSKAGVYANPSHIKAVIDLAIEGGGDPQNEGRIHEERIQRDPPIRYALFHLWPMALVARQAEIHFGIDIWGFRGADGAGLEAAFERYAAYVLKEKTSPKPEKEGDLGWYRWLWEMAYQRWPTERFRQVIESGPRDAYVVQGIGMVALVLGCDDTSSQPVPELPGPAPSLPEEPPVEPAPDEPAPGLEVSGEWPGYWLHTGKRNSLVEDGQLFSLSTLGEETVLKTTSKLENIHSHFMEAEAASAGWKAYTFRGKMRYDTAGGSLGVTFFSDYPFSDSYYRLRSFEGSDFHLSLHPHGLELGCGEASTGVAPRPKTWYHFHVQLGEEALAIRIRARVWEDGAPEPSSWQIDCFDQRPGQRTQGTVGCWSFGPGAKYWTALSVDRKFLAPFGPPEVSTPVPEAEIVSPSTPTAEEPVYAPPPAEEQPAPSGSTPAITGNVSSLSRHGITWSFEGMPAAGVFANGDYWVIGPVKVLSVAPRPASGRHGSMINPVPSNSHGYDSRVSGYNSSLAVSYPVTLQPGESLVSTISWLEGEAGCPPIDSSGAPRPTLKSAAVLTCLSSAPPGGSFRPPYAGRTKTLYSTSRLRKDLLPALPPVAATPSASAMAKKFERVWLDTKLDWSGRYAHPSENMKDYGRDLAAELNDGYLLLLLAVEGKDQVLMRLVQIGIDFYGLLLNGGHWPANGGHGIGRKWPILFAGLMLGDAKMQAIGRDYGIATFSEDCQTFYVTAADKQRFPALFPVIGAPAWGIRHCYAPQKDDQGRGYALCCTINASHGAALCARVLGAVQLWNHPPFFDYVDWHMVEMARIYGVGDSRRSWTRFAEQMWDRYRKDF
jgi:hypothetical protein